MTAEQLLETMKGYSINEDSLSLIKRFEGFRSKPYLDVVKIPTIGYGTITIDNQRVTMQTPECTEAQASKWLLDHVTDVVLPCLVKANIINKINQNQGDALVSFIYNIGGGAFAKSTLLKCIQSGSFYAAADEFLKWDKAGGKPVKGLTIRRQAERELFLS
jgi:lysozyme